MTDTTALIAEGRALVVALEREYDAQRYEADRHAEFHFGRGDNASGMGYANDADVFEAKQDALRAFLDAAARDAAQMDWLNAQCSVMNYPNMPTGHTWALIHTLSSVPDAPPNIRAAIDAAMTQHTALAEPRG